MPRCSGVDVDSLHRAAIANTSQEISYSELITPCTRGYHGWAGRLCFGPIVFDAHGPASATSTAK